MIKAYTLAELADKEKLTKQAVLYRIRKGGYYIPLRLDGKQYAKNKNGYAVRYLIKTELKDYLF